MRTLTLPSASIVLCTCNGERFLPEQLASLRGQSVQAREVVVQDDASDDSTPAILEGEQKRANALPLFVKRNPTRLGFAQNFATALGRARGEVIFLCDQDDIWEPSKVETLLRKFAADPQLAVALSEGSYVDEYGQALPGKILEGNGLSEAEAARWELGEAFPFLLRRNPVPGMLMAFRASLLPSVLPIPAGWEHDYWILLLAAGWKKKFAVEPNSLVRYRRHRGQAVGGQVGLPARWERAGRQTLETRAYESQRLEALRERLARGGITFENLGLVEGKRDHLARISRFSSSRLLRLFEIAAETPAYHRFEAGWSSALKDLLARRS